MKSERRFDPNTHYAVGNTHLPADTSHIKRKYINIPYASQSELQKVDIYLPEEGEGPFPVIISIHGGAFMGCDKSDTQVLPMLEGLKRSYAVVALNYRLSWEAIFPALIYDAKAAVRWIRANALKYHFDPDRIAAWGGSAGGYQSLMLGVTAGISELEDLSMGNSDQPSHITTFVSWYGPTNFLKMDEQLAANGLPSPPGKEHNSSNSPESLLMGGTITEIPDKVRKASPFPYIRPNAAPALIQHGKMDPVVPFQQSVEFAEKMKGVVGEENVVLELLEDAEHADPLFETPDNVSRVLDFLDPYMHSDK
ncbi:MAG: alpha/beta hydrolase [Anaerolineales bacterium]|nr:alpha/beta hydrolase [Anaerolineales bacterium]